MNTKLTLIELIDMLAESTSTSKRVCELFLRELFTTVSQELLDGGSVSIKNIGTFRVVESKSQKTAQANVAKPAHRRITFTPAKSLAEAVTQPFAQFETVILEDAVTDEQLAAIDEKYPSIALDTTAEEAAPAPETPAATLIPDPIEPSENSEPSEIPEPIEPSEISEPSENSEVSEPSKASEPQEQPAALFNNPPVERKPMLVGIPIDGPSHPVPETAPVEEPKDDGYFYRPPLRDAYSPTEEQLSAEPKRSRKWLWALLALPLIAGLLWLVLGRNGSSTSVPDDVVPMDTAEVYVEEDTDVVTETITSQNVLATIAKKHYGRAWFWVYIYEENKDKISNPDNIPIGTEVVVPPAEKYGIDAKDPASIKKAQRRHREIQTLGKR